ncbi:MAG: acetoacetate--CoA ligase [Alphaproteobacteria bacterium]|nr:acetoacetate--CoA ligase [Alphaproteobacteria bacterium]
MLKPLWIPSTERIQNARMTAFMKQAAKEWSITFKDYPTLYQWSITEPEKFWLTVWSFCNVIAESRGDIVLKRGTQFEEARFFPDAHLNYAENLLRRRDNEAAIIFWGEDKVKLSLTYAELYHQVSEQAAALKQVGVQRGDRVAGLAPNRPEAIIAMLATASLGAVWCSCSPDFGIQGILDRFQQIEPKILYCANGYYYQGKQFNIHDKVAEVVKNLPSLTQTIIFSYIPEPTEIKGILKSISWADFASLGKDIPLVFEQLPFNSPLFIMFSSGTTGIPKCIVHGVGGTLLEHLKEHQLHCDIQPSDRVFYFTTCGWMMWNWQVSALASGATLLLYDGSPLYPSGNILFDYAEAEKMTLLGTSAKFIDTIAKAGLKPIKTHHLSSLKMITSTGSPLAPASFDFTYQCIAQDICLASISGGTDIIGCFALGNPIAPVWRGELQTRSLGLAVEVFDDEGNSITQQKGELVCTAPFPSMPLGFWNDPQGARYHKAYFNRFTNVWHHGDFIELTRNDGLIIHGRSDAILNPGGVRIGTAEIYRQVEQIPEVLESMAVGQEWKGDLRVILFVVLRSNYQLTNELKERINLQIRTNTTPRHIPEKIIQVKDIPRTVNGKIVELAVREIINHRKVNNIESIANPEALKLFEGLQELEF